MNFKKRLTAAAGKANQKKLSRNVKLKYWVMARNSIFIFQVVNRTAICYFYHPAPFRTILRTFTLAYFIHSDLRLSVDFFLLPLVCNEIWLKSM